MASLALCWSFGANTAIFGCAEILGNMSWLEEAVH
jgi:hypothetical protein